MKHWQETYYILQTLKRLGEDGRDAALATVVRIRGSAYRRPGAKMLIADDGVLGGSVSGGCLEDDVREVALSVIVTGIPRLLHYDTGSNDDAPWGLGLGCNGLVDIFVQPASVPEVRRMAVRVESLLGGDDPFTVSTVIGGSIGLGRSLVVDADGALEGSTDDAALDRALVARAQTILAEGTSTLYDMDPVQVFTEVQVPPPQMVIFGAGEDARPLARCAADAGFRVAVVDHRPAYLGTDWYPAGTRLIEARPGDRVGDLTFGPRTYAVVKTHMLAHDRDWTAALLASEVPYIGVLGPRARIDDMMQQLGAEGDERVFGPVGLDVGADGPDQIALSIVAEVLSVYSQREPRHLRDREGVIHAG